MKQDEIAKLKRFLQKKYPNYHDYLLKHAIYDKMVVSYADDERYVYYAPGFGYIEISGITNEFDEFDIEIMFSLIQSVKLEFYGEKPA